jgi:toxin CcdB
VRQFDVLPNPSERSRRIAPLVVIVQSHLLDNLPTVIVAPLLRSAERPAFTQVGLSVTFNGEDYTCSLAELSATDVHRLSRPLGSLRDYEYEIRRALDRLFTGF